MRNSLFGLAASLTFGIALLIPGAAEAQICRECVDGDGEGCPYGDHENIATDGFYGNQDDTHGCWAKTCYEMMINMVHLEGLCAEETPSADRMPLASLQGLEDLSLEDASGLLDAHPRQFLLNLERNVLQVLDCRGEKVIAQFEFTPKPTV